MKIIKQGNKGQKKIECPMCGCVYIVDRNDVYMDIGGPYVKCPCCNEITELSIKDSIYLKYK